MQAEKNKVQGPQKFEILSEQRGTDHPVFCVSEKQSENKKETEKK